MSTCAPCRVGRHDHCPMAKVSIRARITTYADSPGETYRCDCSTTDHDTTAQPHLMEAMTE